MIREYSILLIGFFKKEYIELTRYWFNTIIGLIVTLGLFLMLFFGIEQLTENTEMFGNTREALVVGYGLFILFTGAYNSISAMIIDESKNGTLEQLYMSKFPFRNLLVAKVFSSSIFGIILFIAAILLASLITGVRLNIDIISIVPIALISSFSFISLGLLSGGLALVFKKIDGFLQIIQFSVIAFISIPIDKIYAFRFLPGALGTSWINDIMINNESLSSFTLVNYLELFGISVLHLILGIVIYKFFECKAKDLGTLGHY